jgi:outer membrane protein
MKISQLKQLKQFKFPVLPLLLVACTWNVQGNAQAQDFKAGYISIQRITTESNPAKAAQNKLEQEFSKRQKEINDLQNTLKAFSDKFERDNPTMTESQRNTRQREGAEMTRDLQRRQREFQEDLNSRRNEELQQVLDRANKAVKQVADTEKYDVVLQEVVYVNPKHDITDKVLKLLNTK